MEQDKRQGMHERNIHTMYNMDDTAECMCNSINYIYAYPLCIYVLKQLDINV